MGRGAVMEFSVGGERGPSDLAGGDKVKFRGDRVGREEKVGEGAGFDLR